MQLIKSSFSGYLLKLIVNCFWSVYRISQELEHLDLDEEEDEPVFVLTDEWREFFAKSEAKRQQGS